MSACLLAFDTSTELLAVAVAGPRGDRLAQEAGGAAASAALLPCIRSVLADAGVAFADLDAIAFGQGPGAFTGLRTSCAVAQGLGFGLGKPLLAIDSLMLVADDARAQQPQHDDIAVLMDARMDEVYAGRYRWDGRRWRALLAPALYPLPALARLWADGPPQAAAGSALAAFGERLALPSGVAQLPREASRPAALLRLAQALHADGASVDAAAALPLYLRDKVALTTAEREAVRAAAR